MDFTLSEMAVLLDAVASGPEVVCTGASIDSRTVEPGQLFVPLVAERDGHDFIGSALAAGAVAYLTDREPIPDTSALRVADTAAALRALGAAARDRLDQAAVVGITGSVGKTSCKDLCAAVFAQAMPTNASYRSFNNELGVPLTLVNTPQATGALVLEMGARGVGHIAQLCAIARPNVGVVLRVGAAHTEMFGSLDGVARAKGEMVESLGADATAVLNADDHRVAAMSERTVARVLRYGIDEPADLTATDISLDADLRPRFRLRSPWGEADISLGVSGLHNVSNALAAAAVTLSCGVDIEALVTGLGQASLSPWRMELVRTPAGAVVLNDAYNANPVSMRSALASLSAIPADRRIAVLGLMAELGDEHDDEHLAIGNEARAAGIEVISIGVEQYGGVVVRDWREAADRLGDPGAGTAVLCKGSRVAGLEKLVGVMVDTA